MTSEPVPTRRTSASAGAGSSSRPTTASRAGRSTRTACSSSCTPATGVCWTELILTERFEGWEGIAHGGIVCTLLDEVMAWALIDHDLWGVTARMAVEFKRPVPIGRPIRAEGWVAGVRRRLVEAAGVVIEPGRHRAREGRRRPYVGAPEARKEELKARYGFRLEPDEPVAREADAGWTAADGRAARRRPARPPSAPAFVAWRRGRSGASPWAARRASRSTTRPRSCAHAARRAPRGSPIPTTSRAASGRPGIGPFLGVRQPLLRAVCAGSRRHCGAIGHRRCSMSRLPCCASQSLEVRWLGIDLLERTIAAEPELTWQLVRGAVAPRGRMGHGGPLAHAAGRGILAEPYRWAELEQLVYSPSRWERRLIGSTIATHPARRAAPPAASPESRARAGAPGRPHR